LEVVFILIGLAFVQGIITVGFKSTCGEYGRTDAAKTDIANIETALAAYCRDCGRLPSPSEGLDALSQRPAGHHDTLGPYLKRAGIKDPWGNPYVYDPDRGAITGEHSVSSAGPDGIAGTADDITASP